MLRQRYYFFLNYCTVMVQNLQKNIISPLTLCHENDFFRVQSVRMKTSVPQAQSGIRETAEYKKTAYFMPTFTVVWHKVRRNIIAFTSQ